MRTIARATLVSSVLLTSLAACSAPVGDGGASSDEALAPGAHPIHPPQPDPMVRVVGGRTRRLVPSSVLAGATSASAAHSAMAPRVTSNLPTSVSLRPYMTPVRDQGGRGTCVEFASTGLVEYYTGGDVSEQAMVYFNGGNDGAVDQYRLGDFLAKGLVDERLSEYDPNDMNVHVPSGATYASLVARSAIAPVQPLVEVVNGSRGQAAVDYVRQQLATGHPVLFGIYYLDGVMDGYGGNPAENILASPAAPTCNNGTHVTGSNVGGCPAHAMIITGYDDTTKLFEVKNQWGTGWADQGYARMTYGFLVDWQCGNLMTIDADGTPPATAQTIQDVYHQTIGRHGMAWEVDAWANNLRSGWTLGSMRSAFEQDAQFVDAIDAIYQETLGRTPAAWEESAWESNIRGGGWTIDTMRGAFVQDAQATQAIAQVYADVLGRAPSASEASVWHDNIANRFWTIPMMRNSFALSPECATAVQAVFAQVWGRAATDDETRAYVLDIHDKGWSLAQLRAFLLNIKRIGNTAF